MNKLYRYSIILMLIFGCDKKPEKVFTIPDSKDTGINFSNTLTDTKDQNILDYLYYYNGGGVAIGDINNDGLPDIYFTANQLKNKLYLNKGNLQFEDITEKAGVGGISDWNTGVTMADVNGDGFLDIYVCAVVGIKGFQGHNELYINNGDGTFSEKSAQYKLDLQNYSSSATFFDFDLDGDLDIYLLNHAVHTQESFGKAIIRNNRHYESGDKLLRNDNGIYTDISEEAGIYGGVNGYGLSVAISDFNMDGYPDIYVCNDFHEDDYYYVNNGDGTFKESLKQYFGHISKFSMGSDVADINKDGYPDIITLDMLPEDEHILKTSAGDDNVQILKMRTKQYGYYYQFTRNMLQINQQEKFIETALLSGVAATDWSWSALFADYNQDGKQDLFISNGIPKRPNDLDYIKYISNEKIKKKLNTTNLVDEEVLNAMPEGKAKNNFFRGNANLTFTDQTQNWVKHPPTYSSGAAYADLDNDGDLELVTNNINQTATLYKNRTNTKKNYIKLKFQYQSPNNYGIGTKTIIYYKEEKQYRELYPARGFQSSSQPVLHFGLDTLKTIDSVTVIWPDKTFQTLKDVAVNQTLTIAPENTKPFSYNTLHRKPEKLFQKTTDNMGIAFTHEEDNYIDVLRQKLIPYQISDRGPATAVGDLNNDGKKDIFFGGSKHKSARIFLQADSVYTEKRIPVITGDSVKEDVTAVIADLNTDGKNDLFIGTGGGDFYNTMKPLLDSYYTQQDTVFKPQNLPEYFENASVIKINDMDNDGDPDLFVGNHAVSNDFGKIPNSYLLKNDGGNFSIVQNEALQQAGMITDAVWDDFDNDGVKDLIVVGEWMPPKFFKNNNGTLTQVNTIDEKLNGLWQRIIPFDIDGDGDTDYLLGNWGTNTKFSAAATAPMKMYYADFDANGSTETIVCTQKNGKYYPILGLDELAGQIVSLRKKFTTYKAFAGQPITEIFEKNTLANAALLEVHLLQSGYLKNNNGRFSFVPFRNELQLAPITAFLTYDFDKDSKDEVLAAGNYFGVTPFHGRFDAFPGALIKDEAHITLGNQIGLNLSGKAVRHLNIITLKDKPYLLVTINNDTVQLYRLVKQF